MKESIDEKLNTQYIILTSIVIIIKVYNERIFFTTKSLNKKVNTQYLILTYIVIIVNVYNENIFSELNQLTKYSIHNTNFHQYDIKIVEC